MTDKERILTFLLKIFARPIFKDLINNTHDRFWVDPDINNIKNGDLVICETSGVHPYTVGYVEEMSYDYALIRELGGQNKCHVSNESFYSLRGLESHPEMLENSQYNFYIKVLKALARADMYAYRFGGILFNGKTVMITIREVFKDLSDKTSTPFNVCMVWNKKTSIKKILNTLIENGLGTRFEKKEEQK